MHKLFQLALFPALAAVLLGCGQASPAPKASVATAAKPSGSTGAATPAKATYTLKIPYTAPSGVYTALWVAADAGIFRKNGINATVTAMDNNATSAALTSGEIDVSPSPSVLNLISSGGDAVLIASFVSAPIYSVYASSEIASFNDLKGKVIGDTPAGSSPDSVLRALLAKHGLAPDKDVQYLFSPNPATILGAMKTHQAAAGILSAPVTLQAKQAGFKEIANTAKENVPGLQVVVAVRKSTLKEKHDADIALLRSLQQATAFAKSNPDKTKAIIAKYTKVNDPEALNETYADFEPYWQIGPVKTSDVAATLQYSSNPKAVGADPARFIDNSLIESLGK